MSATERTVMHVHATGDVRFVLQHSARTVLDTRDVRELVIEMAQVTEALVRPADETGTSVVGTQFLVGGFTVRETPVLGPQCEINANGGRVEVRLCRTT